MKIDIKTFAILALVVSVVVVSGCSQQGGQNATKGGTTTPAPTQIKSAEEATKTVVDTSKDIKQISDTLSDIDKTLGGKK